MTQVEDAAKAVAEVIRAQAMELGDDTLEYTIWKAAKFYIQPGAKGRPREDEVGGYKWAARLILFGWQDAGAVADSEPENDGVLDGLMPKAKFATLRHVGQWAREQVRLHHAAQLDPEPEGLDDATLERRMLSARVTLHRHKGSLAWWRLPYTVGGKLCRADIRLGRLTDEQSHEEATRVPMRSGGFQKRDEPLPSLLPEG